MIYAARRASTIFNLTGPPLGEGYCRLRMHLSCLLKYASTWVLFHVGPPAGANLLPLIACSVVNPGVIIRVKIVLR